MLGDLSGQIKIRRRGFAFVGVEQHREIVEVSREVLRRWRFGRAMRFRMERGCLRSMSSEKRRIAPNALDSDVPPLKTRVAVVPFGRPKRRFRHQQTQKSFSIIVSATPRPAPSLRTGR